MDDALELIRTYGLGPPLAELPRGKLNISLHRKGSELWMVDADDVGASAARQTGACGASMVDDELLVVAGVCGPDARTVAVTAGTHRSEPAPNDGGAWIVAFQAITPPFEIVVVESDETARELRRHRLEWEAEARPSFSARARRTIRRMCVVRFGPRRTATYGRRRRQART